MNALEGLAVLVLGIVADWKPSSCSYISPTTLSRWLSANSNSIFQLLHRCAVPQPSISGFTILLFSISSTATTFSSVVSPVHMMDWRRYSKQWFRWWLLKVCVWKDVLIDALGEVEIRLI